MSGTVRSRSWPVNSATSRSPAPISPAHPEPSLPCSPWPPLKNWWQPSRLSPPLGGDVMLATTLPNIWDLLGASERRSVAEEIIHILTQEVENERLSQDPPHSSASSGDPLHPPIQRQTSAAQSRKRHQSAGAS